MICFDTSPVIWGVQGAAKTSQQRMIDRTRRYIRFLATENERIMVPAPVLMEYLVAFKSNEQDHQRQLIEQNFFVPSFDIPAALVAAQLLGNRALIKAIQKTEKVNPQSLRIDAQIIAIAIVHGASKIISNDPHFSKLADGKIIIQDVPDIQDQGEMFDKKATDK